MKRTIPLAITWLLALGALHAYGQYSTNFPNLGQPADIFCDGPMIPLDMVNQCAEKKRLREELIRRQETEKREQEQRSRKAKQEQQQKEMMEKVRFDVVETALLQAVSFRVWKALDGPGVITLTIRCKRSGKGMARLRPFTNDTPEITETKQIDCALPEDVLEISFTAMIADKYRIDFPTRPKKKP